MIQRKQTIWLFLAACFLVLTFFVPYGINSSTTATTALISESSLDAKTNIILAILASVTASISLVTIILFKNRSLQMKLCWLLILLCIGVDVYIFYDANLTAKGNKLVVGLLGSHLYLGLLMPLISLFFIILAYLGIKADEKLIRSSDRLR